MKDTYLKPEVEIEKFSMTDIITTSGPTDGNGPTDDTDVPSPF